MTKRALGSDLAKVDAYENTAADYEEIPEIDDAFIEKARRERRVRVDFPDFLTLDDPNLAGRLRALGSEWRMRAQEALKAWVDNGFVVASVPNPFAARMLTKQQTADYCCAGSLPRLDRWRKSGLIPNQVPGTNLFDRHAIDQAIDKMSGIKGRQDEQAAPLEEDPLANWSREARAARRAEREAARGGKSKAGRRFSTRPLPQPRG